MVKRVSGVGFSGLHLQIANDVVLLTPSDFRPLVHIGIHLVVTGGIPILS